MWVFYFNYWKKERERESSQVKPYLDAFKGYDLDEDGYISRDELYQMFKSYFYLSMELVRDVVSAMEDEMMDNFEFSASQPVSAAFNVAIPSTTSSNRNSGSSTSTTSDEEEEGEEEEEEEVQAVDEEQQDPDKEQADGSEAGPSGARQTKRKKKQRYPQKEAYFQQQYAKEQDRQQEHQEHPLSPFPLDYSTSKNKQKSNAPLQPNGDKKTWEEKFPIMETMSQDAINEMVDKTFKNINCKREGYISLEEFKQCVMTDSSIVSWFEALGTVF